MALLRPQYLNDFSGGINLRDAPLGLARNDLIACKNMYPLAGGGIQGRGGQTEYNATAIDANAIKSLYRFYKQNGTGITLATSGTKVWKGNDIAGTFSEIDSGYTSAQRFSFTSWSAKDKTYWINGAEAAKSYDGTTVAALGGSPPVGTQIEFHQDRLWILQPNLVRFSDLNVDNVWPALSALNIADARGGVSSWIKSANGLLVVGKTTGVWRFEGSPLLGGEFRQFSGVQCVAPWSAKAVTITSEDGRTVPVAVVFLGIDGVYITDGYTVELISPKIDPVFVAAFKGAVGEYHPKRRQYWLSFNAAGGANDTTWVATKLDREGGSAIAWSEYTGFKIDSFAVWDGDNGELYAGRSDDGKVRRLDVGSQDVGANYKCESTTRNLDFGDSGINKSVRWLKVVFRAPGVVSYRIDYMNSSQSSATLENITSGTGKWNVGKWNQAKWAGTGTAHTRTSTLFSGQGRYLNLTLWNSGDGPNFRVDEIAIEPRAKHRRTFDLFTLYSDGAVPVERPELIQVQPPSVITN